MTCSGRKISSALLTIMVTAPAVMGAGPGEDRMMKRRVEMVREIRAGVTREAPKAADEYLNRSLTAIGEVPREAFVPEKLRNYAYNLMPLPIGYEQTATDAYAITIMTAALRPSTPPCSISVRVPVIRPPSSPGCRATYIRSRS